MKYNIFKMLLVITFFAITSCEEVIELDLNTVAEQTVIEANLNATDKTCTVIISKSDDFYADNDFEKISGASITISTSSGNTYTLNDQGEGQYFGADILTESGETVTIDISLPDNESYTASAIVPVFVSLDTLLIEENSGGFGGGGNSDENYALTTEWQDTEGEENFYRVKVFRNNEYQSDLYVLTNDALGDGTKLTRPVIGERYALGDELRVQLLSVNKSYHDYFSDIANGEGRGLNTPVPFNPQCNIDQNVLGYFGVWQLSEKVVIVE